MHLYALSTLSSSTQGCLISQFLVSSSSSTITISKVDETSGRLQNLATRNTFSTIIRLIPVSDSSFCVLSDAGSLALVSFNGQFTSTIANFGRTGLRRVTPYYAACDPQSRVIIVGAIESLRLAFVLGMDSTLSSPIDCSLDKTIIYDLCAVDVGYANPLYAQIEAQIGKERQVTFYEFDLGLNILRAKQSISSGRAHRLVPLPQHLQGILVCQDSKIDYLRAVSTRPVQSIAFPGRILCAVVHQFKEATFALLQAEDGKLYKLEFHQEPNFSMTLHFFADIKPAKSLFIFKAGFLYALSEQGDHILYQFNSLGEDDPAIASSSVDDLKLYIAPIEHDEPDNIEQVDSVFSLCGSTCMRLGASRQKLQKNLVIGNGKAMRTIQYSLPTEELVSSDLPKPAVDVFVTGDPSKLIIVTFDDDILVLEVGESVQEVKDSGLVRGKTLLVQEMANTIVQIHSKGIRQMLGKTVDWTAPSPIVSCAANTFQLLVGLEDMTLIYFELKEGLLQRISSSKMTSPILALALEDLPAGRMRSSYAVVGLENSLRVFTVAQDLELTGVQNLTAPPASLFISKELEVYVGQQNGVYVESRIDQETGGFLWTRNRFLGSSPVKIRKVWIADEKTPCISAICKQVWIVFPGHKFDMVPLSFDLTSVARFSTEDSPQMLAGVTDKSLKLFSIEDSKTRYISKDKSLKSAPLRQLLASGKLAVLGRSFINIGGREFPLEHGLKALTFSTCRFDSRKKEMLIVSALRGASYQGFEEKYDEALLLVYEFDDETIELVHSTAVDAPCRDLVGFKGMLIAAVGPSVVFYDIGIKKLLKKKVLKVSTNIVKLGINRNRIFTADSRRSIVVLTYSEEHGFIVVADDTVDRPVSAMTILDYNTVAIGDRFGNFCVLRVPKEATELSSQESKHQLLAAKPSYLNGAFYKLELIAHYYLGDVITSMQLGVFAPGGVECILWSGIAGNLGVFIPLAEDNAKYFGNLQNEMRKETTLLGRSHLSYRGYSAPVKNVIDGDLCEGFGLLTPEVKKAIANTLNTEPEAIEKEVAEFRVSCISMQ